jgi:hypothetical protein
LISDRPELPHLTRFASKNLLLDLGTVSTRDSMPDWG